MEKVAVNAVLAARIAGCTTTIGCDDIDSRLDMAMELGATHRISGRQIGSIGEEAHWDYEGLPRSFCQSIKKTSNGLWGLM